MALKLHVNIRTLLSNCETIVKGEENFWRLKPFIKSLDVMIAELLEHADNESIAKIPEYQSRLDVLKKTINYTESPPYFTTKVTAKNVQDALYELEQMQSSNNLQGDRKRLLSGNAGLRYRKQTDTSAAPANNMNEAVKHYNQEQEKITEHMLSLTQNLKEQTKTANLIIKKDSESLTNTNKITDRNIDSLHDKATTLNAHSNSVCKWWMWSMIGFVFIVFIGMVLFMKIVKKKTRA